MGQGINLVERCVWRRVKQIASKMNMEFGNVNPISENVIPSNINHVDLIYF
jgi:hypothetical protein